MLAKFLLIVFVLYLMFKDEDAMNVTLKDFENIKQQLNNLQSFKARREGAAMIAKERGFDEETIEKVMKLMEENDKERLEIMRSADGDKFKNKKILQILWKMAQEAQMADAYLLDVFEELVKIDIDFDENLVNNKRIRKIRRYIQRRRKNPPTLSDKDLAEIDKEASEMEKLAAEVDAGTISQANQKKLNTLIEKQSNISERFPSQPHREEL
ncbi:unnamed protein product [Caenorhabditis angaria]|uniref:Uncharacterized protein n=1 Tax=Caenorhabditis angaria TaxID=860376 RepID=A0A9P1IWU2_9PELO|nr:unnamed protein product [Caenorhabditis angaria]